MFKNEDQNKVKYSLEKKTNQKILKLKVKKKGGKNKYIKNKYYL